MSAQRITKEHKAYTVGWVCALPLEQTAAIAMLDERHRDLPKPSASADPNVYTLGSIGNHNIVVTCLPKSQIGTISAASVAAHMVHTFPSIKFALMIGIGGGIPPNVRLGDVVVGTPVKQFPAVIQWDSGKATSSGFERTGALNNPPTLLLSALTRLESENDLCGSHIDEFLDELKEKYPRLAAKSGYLWSDSLSDLLFESTYNHPDQNDTCQSCDATKIVQREPRERQVHYGLIASGNQVIKDAAFRDKLNRDLGGNNILCVEMEAAGLMNSFPCLVIRGICDYADSHKNKYWQKHAAAVAAAFAKELLGYVQPNEVDQAQPVKNLIAEVHNIMSRAEANIEKVYTRLTKDEDSNILDWLTTIDYSRQHNDIIARQQPKTGNWLLESETFQEWLTGEGTDCQTLFCPGIPGAGKTIATAIVLDHLLKLSEDEQTVGIAYIYFNFKQQQEQTFDLILLNILKQLSQRCYPLPVDIRRLYETHEKRKTRPTITEIIKLSRSILMQYSKVFIVVDALDESEASCRSGFISEIFRFQRMGNVKLFATSRHIPDIKARFKGALALEISASAEDMRNYLEAQLPTIDGIIKYYPDLQQEAASRIIAEADGMFLLAHLRLQSLIGKESRKEVRRVLEKRVKGSNAYDEAYATAIESIQGSARDSAMKVLAWISCGKKILKTKELLHALAVEIGQQEFDKENLSSIRYMVSLCRGLVVVDEESETVRLVHYTTQDYFDRTWASWFPNAHKDIAETCITYLKYDSIQECFRSVHNAPVPRESEQGYFEDKSEYPKPFYNKYDGLRLHYYQQLLAQEQAAAWKRQSLYPLHQYSLEHWCHHALYGSGENDLVINYIRSISPPSSQIQLLLARFSGNASIEKCNRYWAGVDKSPQHGMVGIHLGAYLGLTKSVESLLSEGFHVDTKDSWGWTPLWWAVEAEHESMISLLLKNGADVDSRDNWGRTALSWVAATNANKMAVLLLSNGAKIEAKDDVYRKTPLSWAIEFSNEAIVDLLLRNGANTEDRDGTISSPLMSAVITSNVDIAEMLLKKGAHVDSKDAYGRTPLWMAAVYDSARILSLLIDYGGNMEQRGPDGKRLLYWMLVNRNLRSLEVLVEKGVDLKSGLEDDDTTPLMWAVDHCDISSVHILLEAGGASINCRDKDNSTALHYAVMKKNYNMIQLLIERGACKDDKDNCGRTPVDLAKELGIEDYLTLIPWPSRVFRLFMTSTRTLTDSSVEAEYGDDDY